MATSTTSSDNSSLYDHEYMTMKRCRHGTFLFNKLDTFIGRSLDLYGEWCESEVSMLTALLNPGDIVLDVGANIGTHTIPFARCVDDHGCVLAFEPQRIPFQNLCANVALNSLRNVVTHEAGVGRELTWGTMPVIDPRKPYNFGAVSMHGHASGSPVRLLTIDDLKLPRCRLIKIDVEGMEVDVLAGAKTTVQRCQPVLFIENNSIDRSRELIETLIDLDYIAYWHISSYYNTQNFFGNPDNVFQTFRPEANLFCYHKTSPISVGNMVMVEDIHDTWQRALERLIKMKTLASK
jgi:FkbM family methyltransferase